MRHLVFSDQDTFHTALLIKESAFIKQNLVNHYIEPIEKAGVSRDDVISFTLTYDGKKCSASLQNKYLKSLMPALKQLDVQTILCADTNYFKTLTKVRKVDPHYGYVMPCKLEGYEGMNVILLPNYQALFYKPEVQDKVDMGIQTYIDHLHGNYVALGSDVVKSEHYPLDAESIRLALQELHQYPMLAVDIETFSLNFWETGIATIGFAWNQHEGIAFPVDTPEGPVVCNTPNQIKREILRKFFETYDGTLVWHNANFDTKVIVNTLWMTDLLDEPGKQQGIEFMTRSFHDTKILSYLATNSTAGNTLSLKDQAHEFAGNWAQSEINDITKIPLNQLLTYNLVDCLSTFYLFNKHFPTVQADQQEEIYNSIMLPSVKVILQMELTGMPINMQKVAQARQVLETEMDHHLQVLQNLPFISQLEYELTKNAWKKDFEDRRSKAKNPDKIQPKLWDEYLTKARITFNPGSNNQLQYLLYTMLHLPVLDLTDTKQPAVGADTLKKLRNHTQDPDILALLESLVEHADAAKILSTFIAAFERAVLKSDGWYYLHGNFNLGGTVSGRLSSSGPNLQNIPSTGNKWAKLVKECFQAPPGWLFVGADFASLEDRISALTTKDPEKLKVYTDGYDGHSLRAYGYFGSEMPDIDPTSVDSINSIGDKYKKLRQKSKGPTFALTYGGTYHTLMNNLGLSEDEAKQIEANYHRLYHVSDQWVADKIQQASKDGYVTVAFGLRVRTPLLSQVLWNSKKTPYEAKKEGRTAGNALGQSYGLLNNRAGIEFQERTLASEFRYNIKPVAHIHDAQYFLVKDEVYSVHFLNQELTDCMKWQNLPEIYHPDVGLGGELDIFYPNWAHSITLSNELTLKELLDLCTEAA